MNILTSIVEAKQAEVYEAKRRCPLAAVRKAAKPGQFRMAEAFSGRRWGLIAECKQQSPVKGCLCRKSVLELAAVYEANGAAMLSIHTDKHFGGCTEDLRQVSRLTNLPVLRKDFIVDEYQLYESRMLGADAVLLIASLLETGALKDYAALAHSLGMDVLVEVHDAAEVEKALGVSSQFIGINNRNLQTFDTSVEQTFALLPLVDNRHSVISESGIRTAADAERLYEAGCKGILVGEGLVAAEDIAVATSRLARLPGRHKIQ